MLWALERRDWGNTSARLAAAFREARLRDDATRGWIAGTLHGLVKERRRIEAALHGTKGSGPLVEVLSYQLLHGEIEVAEARAKVGHVDWERVLADDEEIAAISDPAERLGVRRGLPDWLAAELIRTRGEEDADELARALADTPPIALRANTLKTTAEALAARLLEEHGLRAAPGKLSGSAVVLETRANVFPSAAFQEGAFEVQDEGSQLVAELVAPPPGGVVIDACAGAGGKTLAIGAQLGGRGRVLALDPSERKIEELRRRARRAGLSNVQALAMTAEGDLPAEAAALLGRADRVLIDVPCSGVGVLRRNPELRWRVQPGDLERLSRAQLEIARRFSPLVRPGGRLIYATCSILPEENQAVVERIAELGFGVVSPIEIWGRKRAAALTGGDERFLELLPHRHDTDGFFAAVLRRR